MKLRLESALSLACIVLLSACSTSGTDPVLSRYNFDWEVVQPEGAPILQAFSDKDALYIGINPEAETKHFKVFDSEDAPLQFERAAHNMLRVLADRREIRVEYKKHTSHIRFDSLTQRASLSAK